MDLWGSGISGEVGQDWICLLAEELVRRVSATFLTSLTERTTPRLRGSCVGCFLDLDFDEDEGSIGSTARARERERFGRVNVVRTICNLSIFSPS